MGRRSWSHSLTAPGVHRVVRGAAAGSMWPRDARPSSGGRRRALGFWCALAKVFPESGHQRDWVQRVANDLNCLPGSAQPAVRKPCAQIRHAKDHKHAEKAIKNFAPSTAPNPQGSREDHWLPNQGHLVS